MSKQNLIIDGRMPSLNEYINACRTHRQIGAKMKLEYEEIVLAAITNQHILPILSPVVVSFKFYEKNKRRDKDNIESFAKKVIMDALQKGHILPNDNWKYVLGYTSTFDVDKLNPRIEVCINERNEEND